MKYLPLIIIVMLSGCVSPLKTFEKIPPGIWRGVFLLDRTPVVKYGDDRDIIKKFDIDSEVPFTFEVIYDNDTSFHIVIHNDSERIKVTDISFNRDKATAKDTILINFPIYDTKISAIYEDGVMEGDWIVNYLNDYKIPFKAIHGKSDRFYWTDQSHIESVEGTWKCLFGDKPEDQYPAIGTFKQSKDRVVGTFQTETGDYRFLEGKMLGNKLYLSSFDGAHVYLFTGLVKDGTISGTFRSGSKYMESWEAIKSDSAQLKNPFDITKAVNDKLEFTFTDTNGKRISNQDPEYNNKVKIIQIMGTWCPNCMDETVFLQEYMSKHTKDDIAVFSVGFERYKDSIQSIESLRRFKDRMNIHYSVLYGGYYDKTAASAQFPQLSKITSYPTLIVTDKSNKIVGIHTGFNGPATMDYHTFMEEFDKLIELAKNNP